MKRFLLLFTLFIGLTSHAQERVPLVREGVEWGYLCQYHTFYTAYPRSEKHYYRMQFKGDTIIRDKAYKKLYVYRTDKLDESKTPCNIVMREEGDTIYSRAVSFDVHFTDYYTQFFDFELGEEYVSYYYDREHDEWRFCERGYVDDYNIFKPNGTVMIENGVDFGVDYKVYSCGNNAFIEGIGIVGGSDRCYFGNLPTPLPAASPNGSTVYNNLLYVRDLKGNIIYHSPMFDELADGDRTLNPNSSEEYTPLVREGVEWGNLVWTADGKRDYYRLQFSGTQEVDGVTYNVLYAYNTPELNTSDDTVYALMREDDKCVYVVIPDS